MGCYQGIVTLREGLPHTRASYLASPPLCIAYAIAGTVCIDMEKEPLGMRMWFRVCGIEYVC